MEVNDVDSSTTLDTRDRMLTTTDNPFDPFTEYEAWYTYDVTNGYHTNSYLARVCVSSNELSEADDALAINDAIDSILKINPFGVHIAVERGDIKKD